MGVSWRLAISFAAGCCSVLVACPEIISNGLAEDAPDPLAVAALAEAYPAFLERDNQSQLRWRDGAAISWGALRRFDKVPASVDDASLNEQFSYSYSLDPWNRNRLPEQDPGRLRNQAFFVKMYGDCRKGEVQPKLRTVVWLPKTAPQRLQVTTVNGIDKAVQDLSADIEALSSEVRTAASQLSGGFACRTISGTKSLSMHAYGAAIDLKSSAGRYWKWSGLSVSARRFNGVPDQLTALFEKHGFIWGGKWYHVDSLHFEYRPELIAYAKSRNAEVERYIQEHPL
jgi:hypothetical protein